MNFEKSQPASANPTGQHHPTDASFTLGCDSSVDNRSGSGHIEDMSRWLGFAQWYRDGCPVQLEFVRRSGTSSASDAQLWRVIALRSSSGRGPLAR